jgi:hypothetical protein
MLQKLTLLLLLLLLLLPLEPPLGRRMGISTSLRSMAVRESLASE